MFEQRHLREFISKGYATFDLEIGGRKIKYRTLRVKELYVITAIQEHILIKRLMTSQMFGTLDSFLKLVFGIEEVDGKPLEPAIESEWYNKIVKATLSTVGEQEYEQLVNDFVSNIIMPRIEFILELPALILEEIINQINVLQDKIKEALSGNEEVEKN